MVTKKRGAKPRWVSEKKLGYGQYEIRLKKIDYLVDCLTQKYGLDINKCIYRGQRKHGWAIKSSFDRASQFKRPDDRRAKLDEHLQRFKRSIAGRRGSNPPQYQDAGDWWALGQHYGLWTPLIDWSRSPWIGLFFALEQPRETAQQRPVDRAVYCLHWSQLYSLTDADLAPGVAKADMLEAIDFHECFPEDNPRLLSQSGLFSFSRRYESVDLALRKLVRRDYKGPPLLVKVRIPDDQRQPGVRLLRSMNINHVTLFPDISGAGLHANALLDVMI